MQSSGGGLGDTRVCLGMLLFGSSHLLTSLSSICAGHCRRCCRTWLMGSWFPAQSPNQWTAREFPIACNFHLYHPGQWGFPDSSVGKESACNARDPSSIPGLGRSAGEEIGYPLQYSRASLVAQLIKNPPAMRETWIRSLGWEDPLEKGKATHSSILAWRINSMDCVVHGVAKGGHD